jgi:hypothetical protein
LKAADFQIFSPVSQSPSSIGRVKVLQPRATARQIHALMDGLSLQWLREKQAFDMVSE